MWISAVQLDSALPCPSLSWSFLYKLHSLRALAASLSYLPTLSPQGCGNYNTNFIL